jgi:hypothetical protein
MIEMLPRRRAATLAAFGTIDKAPNVPPLSLWERVAAQRPGEGWGRLPGVVCVSSSMVVRRPTPGGCAATLSQRERVKSRDLLPRSRR